MLETPDTLFIILDLVDGGELLERITHSRKLEEHEAKLIFYQIVRGVKYLHDNLISHRDLKVSRRYIYIYINLVEDNLLCLKYSIKMKLNMYSM